MIWTKSDPVREGHDLHANCSNNWITVMGGSVEAIRMDSLHHWTGRDVADVGEQHGLAVLVAPNSGADKANNDLFSGVQAAHNSGCHLLRSRTCHLATIKPIYKLNQGLHESH